MRLFIFLMIVFPCLAFSQDSTMVSNEQIIRAAEKIKNQQDSIQSLKKINEALIVENNIQSVVIQQRDDEIELMTSRINFSDDIIADYQDHLKKDKRIKNGRIFYFIGGLVTAYILTR